MKNKIFHTQDLCLRTNLRCAKDSARMEINLKKYIAAIGICFMALGAACIMKKDPEEVGEELPEYYGAAEPPVRCGESHLSGLTEPLRSL